MNDSRYVLWFDELRMTDVSIVGGKNASLGEMISQLAEAGVRVPGGFATTADAYRDFLDQGGLTQRIEKRLSAFGRRFICGTAGNLSQYTWIGQFAEGGQGRVCVTLQRPCYFLSRTQRLYSFRSGAIRRRAADGSQRHRRRRRDVHSGYRIRF